MDEVTSYPILVLTSNLLLLPRIQQSAGSQGHRIETLGPITSHDPPETEFSNPSLTEPLHGRDGAFMRQVVEMQPVLVMIDLDSKEIPWERWIQVLKTSAATRRIPILAYGPHVEVEKQQLAVRLGADKAISRAKLHASLPALIEEFTGSEDWDAIRSACKKPLSPTAVRGIELLNEGLFYDAHEVLEQAWFDKDDARRNLYRAFLQLAVSFHHLKKGNISGARKLLLRMQQWLSHLPDSCCDIQIVNLLDTIKNLAHRLKTVTHGDGLDPSEDWFFTIPLPSVE